MKHNMKINAVPAGTMGVALHIRCAIKPTPESLAAMPEMLKEYVTYPDPHGQPSMQDIVIYPTYGERVVPCTQDARTELVSWFEAHHPTRQMGVRPSGEWVCKHWSEWVTADCYTESDIAAIVNRQKLFATLDTYDSTEL